jgi:hypothetical protein
MQNKKEQREQMMVMIEDWQSSGLNQRTYCAAKNVAYSVFHYWYGLYRKKKTATGSFLPVKVTSAVSKEQITIVGASGIKVQIPLTKQSIDFVKQLLLA